MLQEFPFKQMQVYQMARAAAVDADVIARSLERHYWPVSSQLLRASMSVMLNLAEGSGEYATREKARFYRMSRRSCYEVAAVIDHLAGTGAVTQEAASNLDRRLARVAAALTALIRAMDARPPKAPKAPNAPNAPNAP